ncbi:MAG TPA: DUF5302 domain-containing protein [Actinomycetes bacterium]|nr:DUF5302 domain-containing protein [Actinomycetes bacterium]
MSDAAKKPAADDETRRRYREALDRKKAAEHASADHEDNKGLGPSHNQSVGRREFRRKSG